MNTSNPNISVQHVPTISPYLIVADVKIAMDFYQHAFGFSLAGEPYSENDEIVFAAMQLKESMILVGQEGKLGAAKKSPKHIGEDSPVGIYVYVDNVDAFFEKAVQAGATIVYKPADKAWGDRVCKLQDPDEHIWGFATVMA